MTGNEEFLQLPEIAARSLPPPPVAGLRVWTDDHADLYPILLDR